MKPTFALFLLPEGVSLAFRAQDHWALVGSVSFGSADMADALAHLRAEAFRLSSEPLRSKLVIPNEQVKYLSIETGDISANARREAACAALDGSTPYDISELAFDICAEGDRTHVAAVAQETLAEAEAFATAHGFEPVSFVAAPGDVGFLGEPFFGLTARAATLLEPGTQIDRDGEPCVIAAAPQASVGAAEAQDESPVQPASAPAAIDTGSTQDGKNLTAEHAALLTARRGPVLMASRTEQQVIATPRWKVLGGALAAVFLIGVVGFAAWTFGWNELEEAQAPSEAPQLASIPEETIPVESDEGRLEPQEATSEAANAVPPQTEEPLQDQNLASLDPELTDEDAAVLDALQDPLAISDETLPANTQAAAEARYAVTGIWPLAPEVPRAGPLIDISTLYVTSVATQSPSQDAVILPVFASLDTDQPLSPRTSPAPAGTLFSRDDTGRVEPTEEGAITPGGYTVFAGRPPVEPPNYPQKSGGASPSDAELSRLAAFRPKVRPTDQVEPSDRVAFNGLTRSELAEWRPRARPETISAAFEATESVSLASVRPSLRPRALSRTTATTSDETARSVAAAVAPTIPSSASVAREATLRNVLNLRRVNLIGVYGTASARRALIRLENGQYKKVKVGDTIDGGRISAIGESELRYLKGGRNLVLTMPQG